MKTIEALYAWIGVYPDGSESVLYATLPRCAGHLMPLLACDRATAESFSEVARRVQREGQGDRKPRRVVLRTFAAALVENPIIGITYADPREA